MSSFDTDDLISSGTHRTAGCPVSSISYIRIRPPVLNKILVLAAFHPFLQPLSSPRFPSSIYSFAVCVFLFFSLEKHCKKFKDRLPEGAARHHHSAGGKVLVIFSRSVDKFGSSQDHAQDCPLAGTCSIPV